MQLWDAWGLMFSDQKVDHDENQLNYLDKIAELTVGSDIKFCEIMDHFGRDYNLMVPGKIISFSPVYKRKEIYLDNFLNEELNIFLSK